MKGNGSSLLDVRVQQECVRFKSHQVQMQHGWHHNMNMRHARDSEIYEMYEVYEVCEVYASDEFCQKCCVSNSNMQNSGSESYAHADKHAFVSACELACSSDQQCMK